MQELSRNLQRFKGGEDRYKLKYYVGHDGIMVRLYKSLGLAGQFKWPAMGSEVVIEVYKQKNEHYVRLLKDGKPMQTVVKDIADEQGTISWVRMLFLQRMLLSAIRNPHTHPFVHISASNFDIHKPPSTRSSPTSTPAYLQTSTPSVFSESKRYSHSHSRYALRSAQHGPPRLPHHSCFLLMLRVATEVGVASMRAHSDRAAGCSTKISYATSGSLCLSLRRLPSLSLSRATPSLCHLLINVSKNTLSCLCCLL
ncbi:uncharacterized protein UHOD_11572 [Ustilago sp. UG-2017b]|nr:uncharacterized protein UHOD_11572 [Ustilago sp. UG-2017b]